jgi:hypothetical protein
MGTFVQKGSLVFFLSEGEESSSFHQVFFCCCCCGSNVKEMIPTVIQKYHCSAFNSILFSEMIKTWQTQTDRQSFFLFDRPKNAFSKSATHYCVTHCQAACFCHAKKRESDQFPKKKNFKSILI